MFARKTFFAGIFTLASVLLVPSSRAAVPPPTPHTVGGTISGLTGSTLIVQNNGRDDFEANATGAFVFGTALPSGSQYNVTIRQQPRNPTQTCTAHNGAGVVGRVNVTTVVIECAAVVSQVARFVYASNDDTVSIYAVDAATGRLRPRGYARTGLLPHGIVTDPSGRFAYAANQGDLLGGSVSAFRIDAASGALTRVNVTGAPVGNVTGIAVDPSGRFVYVSEIRRDVQPIFQGYVMAYALDQASGALTRIGATHFRTEGIFSTAIAVEPTGRFVYVVNQRSNDISIFAIDQTSGGLTEPPAHVATGDAPGSIAIDPRGRFLYVTNSAAATVSIFQIDPGSGALRAVGGPVPTGAGPTFIAIDSSGQHAYVANVTSDSISAYQVDPTTGALTEVQGSPFATRDGPNGISIDPSGGFIRVTHLNSNDIATFAINPSTGGLLPLASDAIVRGRAFLHGITTLSGTSPVVIKPKLAYVAGNVGPFGPGRINAFTVDSQSGALAPVAGSPFAWGGGPGSMATDTGGRFNYVVRSSVVDAFRIDAGTGALATIPGSPYNPGWIGPADVTVEPSNRFLYVANAGTFSGAPEPGTVSVFGIDPTSGSLTAPSGNIFFTGVNPFAITSDPAGRFVYTADALSNTITAFRINVADGLLIGVPGSPFATGSGPSSVNVEATGRYGYATSSAGIFAYAIDGITGTLSTVSGSPFVSGGSNPSSIATDPFARFAYVANSFSNNLTAFRINAANGALIPVAGGSYPVGSRPTRVSVDPSGRFVYVTNQVSHNVSVFAIDAVTGALTAVAGSPFSTGDAAAQAIVITGTIE